MDELAAEARLFDKPGGVDFVTVMPAIDWVAFAFSDFGFFVGEIDVFKERARTGFIEWIGEFVGADGADDAADALGAKIGNMMCGEVIFNRIIEWVRHLTASECERDGDDEITTTLSGIKDGLTVGKVKVGF